MTQNKNETWILSDSTKGMENQSIALAKMLNANFKLINYNPPYFLKKFPTYTFIRNHRLFGTLEQAPFLGDLSQSEQVSEIKPPLECET